MTVQELIAELAKLPQDAIVISTNQNCCGCSPKEVDVVEFDGEEVFVGVNDK